MGLVINLEKKLNFTPLESDLFVTYVTIKNKSYRFGIKLTNDEVYEGRLKKIVELISSYTGLNNTILYIIEDEFENKILFDLDNNVSIKIVEIKTNIFDMSLV